VYDLAEIPPAGMRGIVIEGLPQETLQVEAQLDGSDTLALDDQAAAVRPDAEPVPVTLVTPATCSSRPRSRCCPV
jgi:hypothetical protein